ncbi:MAG: hypothetical protein IIC95_06930 [Chloroflexi bacterium]|nr:hypothetical protein [Chloroflexota bacterium]
MTHTGSHKIVTRTLLALAAVVGIMGSVLFVAQAASLTSMTLTLSDSEPGATATYDFAWTGSTSAKQGVRLEFCQEASGSCTLPAGDFDSTSASLVSGTFFDAGGWAVDASGNGVIDLSSSVADSQGAITVGISGIVNTGTTSTTEPIVFYVRITTYSDESLTTPLDGESVVASAVIPVISVTGTQDAILQMTVAGATGTVDNSSKSVTGTATATALPFGNFVPLGITSPTPSSRALAQTINVVTNGVTGYTASVQGEANAMTRSGGSETIGYVASDVEWVEGIGGTAGFGVSAEGGHAPASFDTDTNSALEYEPISSSLVIASNSAPTNGADTTVIFRVQVDATTPAGDYSGSVNYTVLPNF